MCSKKSRNLGSENKEIFQLLTSLLLLQNEACSVHQEERPLLSGKFYHLLILGSNDLQVPGAELGEGGSVVDLSHIAPSVLALIQVAA